MCRTKNYTICLSDVCLSILLFTPLTFYIKFGKIARTVLVLVMAVVVVWARWCPCRSWVHGEVICVSGGIWCCQLVGNKLGASSGEENIFVFMRCDNNNIGRDLTARLWLILSNWKKKLYLNLNLKIFFKIIPMIGWT